MRYPRGKSWNWYKRAIIRDDPRGLLWLRMRVAAQEMSRSMRDLVSGDWRFYGYGVEERTDCPPGQMYFMNEEFTPFTSLPTQREPVPPFDPETVDEDGDKGYGWVQEKGDEK